MNGGCNFAVFKRAQFLFDSFYNLVLNRDASQFFNEYWIDI